MPMPMEYQHASEDFDRFLTDLIEISGLATRNQVYTMAQAVLLVFRRRLDVRDALRFAAVLPPILRAIFVADWNADEPVQPFAGHDVLTDEVQGLRRHHNFASGTAIRNVATALRRHVDQEALDRVIATLPAGAADFWQA